MDWIVDIEEDGTRKGAFIFLKEETDILYVFFRPFAFSRFVYQACCFAFLALIYFSRERFAHATKMGEEWVRWVTTTRGLSMLSLTRGFFSSNVWIHFTLVPVVVCCWFAY